MRVHRHTADDKSLATSKESIVRTKTKTLIAKVNILQHIQTR